MMEETEITSQFLSGENLLALMVSDGGDTFSKSQRSAL